METAKAIKSRFGANVRRFREGKALSQEQLADLIGIHRTYIGGIERGERNPTLTMIERIACALSLEAAALVRHRKD